jgi:hypothetical protein
MIKPQLLITYLDNYNIQTTCIVSHRNISTRPHNLCHLLRRNLPGNDLKSMKGMSSYQGQLEVISEKKLQTNKPLMMPFVNKLNVESCENEIHIITSASMMNRLLAGIPRNRSSIPDRCRDISLLHSVQT